MEGDLSVLVHGPREGVRFDALQQVFEHIHARRRTGHIRLIAEVYRRDQPERERKFYQQVSTCHKQHKRWESSGGMWVGNGDSPEAQMKELAKWCVWDQEKGCEVLAVVFLPAEGHPEYKRINYLINYLRKKDIRTVVKR